MGVTIDIGGKGIEIATTQDLTQQFAHMYDWLLQTIAREEIPKPLQQSKTTPAAAATYTYLDMGTPAVGWLWDLMRFGFAGNDPTATVAGSVWAFLGSVPPDSAQINQYPELFEIPSVTIPNQAFYSRQQVVVRPGQHFVLAFKGLPNTTQINANGLAIQYRDPAAGSPVNTLRRPK